MKLLTDRLREPKRSMVRFCVVGLSGTVIQYLWYHLFLWVFDVACPEYNLVSVAFTIGYILELISNYILSSYYTFSSKPDLKNAGGFLLGRGINYLIQMALLQVFIHWVEIDEKPAGFFAIFVAGIINYFVLRFFFKKTR